MANRRMISSTTWRDEFIGSITFFERCLWIGLFSTCADDQGRLLDNPILIKGDVFPYDEIPTADVETGIVKFEQEKKIQRYQIKGKKYIQILRWWENQRPQWAARSKYTAPDGWIDRIRTRENGEYFVENWLSSYENTPKQSCEEQASVQAGGQYPVPIPVNVPIPNPVKDINLNEPQNFMQRILKIIPYQFKNNDQPKLLDDLIEDYGMERVLSVASWCATKRPKSMGHAISMITTAIKGWNVKDEKPNNEKVLEEWLKNGNKGIGNESDAEVVQASPANQVISGNA